MAICLSNSLNSRGLGEDSGQRRRRPSSGRAAESNGPSELSQDVLHSLDQTRAILYERVASPIPAGSDIPGNRQHVPALLQRQPRGDERPALLAGLDDDDGPGQGR